MNSIREFLINYYSLIDNSGLELTSNHLVGSIFPALVGGDVVITLPPLPGIGSGIAGLGVLISWWLLICYDLYKEKKEEENNQVVVNIVVYVDTRYIILFDHAEPSARYLTMLYSDVAHLWVPRPYPLWHEGTIHYGLRFDLNSFNMRFLSLMNPLLFETRVLTPAQIYSIRGFPLSELYFTMPMIAPSANVGYICELSSV